MRLGLLGPGFIGGIAVADGLGSKSRGLGGLGGGLIIEGLRRLFRGGGPAGKSLLGRRIAHLGLLRLLMLIRGALPVISRLIAGIGGRAAGHAVHLIGDLIGIYGHGLGGQQINAGTGNLGNGCGQGIAGAAESIHQPPLFRLIIDVFHHDQHCIPITQQGNGAAAIPNPPGIDDPGAEGRRAGHLGHPLLGRHLLRLGLHGRLLHRGLLRLGLHGGLLHRRLLRPLIRLECRLRPGLLGLHRVLRLGLIHLRLGLITLLKLLRGRMLHLLLVSAKIHDVIPPLLICLLYGLLGRGLGLIARSLRIFIALLVSGQILFPIIEEAIVYRAHFIFQIADKVTVCH